MLGLGRSGHEYKAAARLALGGIKAMAGANATAPQQAADLSAHTDT